MISVHPALIDFPRSETHAIQPDTLEYVANLCLWMLRNGLGVEIAIPRADTYQDMDRLDCIAQIFLTVISLTIFLPVTLIGLAAWHFSETHDQVYHDYFQFISRPLPPPPTPDTIQLRVQNARFTTKKSLEDEWGLLINGQNTHAKIFTFIKGILTSNCSRDEFVDLIPLFVEFLTNQYFRVSDAECNELLLLIKNSPRLREIPEEFIELLNHIGYFSPARVSLFVKTMLETPLDPAAFTRFLGGLIRTKRTTNFKDEDKQAITTLINETYLQDFPSINGKLLGLLIGLLWFCECETYNLLEKMSEPQVYELGASLQYKNLNEYSIAEKFMYHMNYELTCFGGEYTDDKTSIRVKKILAICFVSLPENNDTILKLFPDYPELSEWTFIELQTFLNNESTDLLSIKLEYPKFETYMFRLFNIFSQTEKTKLLSYHFDDNERTQQRANIPFDENQLNLEQPPKLLIWNEPIRSAFSHALNLSEKSTNLISEIDS